MTSLHLWRIFLATTTIILLTNILFIDWIWLQDHEKLDQVVNRTNQLTRAFTNLGVMISEEQEESSSASNADTKAQDLCGPACKTEIQKAVKTALDAQTVASSTVGVQNLEPLQTIISKSGTFYIPLSGTGSTSNRDWTDIATTETVIDWAEYGADKTVTWDAYAKVHQGNGEVQLRLYDKTNNVVVPYSELTSGSENSVHLVSSQLTVWSGKNTYIVQARTLTGYTAFFESGRIKVIVR